MSIKITERQISQGQYNLKARNAFKNNYFMHHFVLSVFTVGINLLF